MTTWLKQSTAVTIRIGPFVDTDGAFVTGLTIQKADVRLSKNGGDYAAASADQGASDAGAAYDEVGEYDIALDTTDTGTLGRLRVSWGDTGALPTWRDFMIVPANEYDSLVLGTDALDVNAVEVSGDSGAADNLEAAFDGTGYAQALPAGASPMFGIIDAGTAQAIAAGTITLRSAAAFGDDVLAGATVLAHGSTQGYWQSRTIASNVGATDVATLSDNWTVTPSGTVTYVVIGTPPGSGIEVALADGAISAAKFSTGAIDAAAIAADAITAAKVASDVGTEIGAAVWATGTRVLTAGTNIALAKGTGVTGFNDLDAAGVRTAVGLGSANLDTQLAALPTASENADAVWEEALADHEGTVGSTAEALADAGGAGASAADIADAVLDEALSGHTTAGTLGKAIADTLEDTGTTIPGTIDALPTAAENAAQVRTELATELARIDAPLSTVDTVVDAIKVKTDSLTFTQAGQVDANVKRVADVTIDGAGTEADPFGPA